MSLRCAYCHGLAEDAQAVGCPGCGTLLHTECWEDALCCPTLGCRAIPQPRRAGRWPMLLTVFACLMPAGVVARRACAPSWLLAGEGPQVVDVRPPGDPTRGLRLRRG